MNSDEWNICMKNITSLSPSIMFGPPAASLLNVSGDDDNISLYTVRVLG